MILKEFINKYKIAINSELDALLPPGTKYPKEIHSAMRYAVFSGNPKRIRPLLAIASAAVFGGSLKDILRPAAAIELIHSYSLVHDDLPAMDNSDLRRGKPSVHKKFGEDAAILCGDALLIQAFEILSECKDKKIAAIIINEIAKSIGSNGMIGGQLIDMRAKSINPDLPTIEYINTHKTGALIEASLKIGAVSSGASKAKIKLISEFGEYLGITFQIVDDILDRDGVVKILGITDAYKKAAELTKKGKEKLKIFGSKADILKEIADYILERRI